MTCVQQKLPVTYLLFTRRGRISRSTYWHASVLIWCSFYILYTGLDHLWGPAGTWLLYPFFFWSAFAQEGVEFKEIAGNTSAILVTVLAPRDWTARSEDFKPLFTQLIPTLPGTNRVALATPVNRLHTTLRQLQQQNIVVEHVYDF